MTLVGDSNLNRGLRLCVGLGGGYFFTNAFIAFASVGLEANGLVASEALTLALLLGFLLFPGLVIWAAATRFPILFSIALTLGTLVMFWSATALGGDSV